LEDDNAFAHIRSALLGNSRTFAVYNGELQIGNWQQIVLADFDNKSRVRKIVLQLIY
jgi:secondary thiamine-phosphate synthase enzyme